MPSSTLPPQPADRQADFWLVASASGHQPYTVRHTPDRKWLCDCPAWFYGKGKECKHIRAAKGWYLLGFSGTHENPAIIDAPVQRKQDMKGDFQRQIRELKKEVDTLKKELKRHVEERHAGTDFDGFAHHAGTDN